MMAEISTNKHVQIPALNTGQIFHAFREQVQTSFKKLIPRN